MVKRTGIEWTEVTWNPTTGCDRVSPGCDNCYALSLAGRLKAMGSPKYQQDGDPRTSGPGFGLTIHDRLISQPLAWKTPRMIFVNSMSDLFHDGVTDEFIDRIMTTIRDTPQHTYQILTKRGRRLARLANQIEWPSNAWIGVSVESQKYAFRIDQLRTVPTQMRFLSLEPLLGPLELNLSGIGWMIVGGESGPKSRPMNPDWVRSLRDQAISAKVPFFFKQWGGLTPKSGGRTLDDQVWSEMPTQSDHSSPQ